MSLMNPEGFDEVQLQPPPLLPREGGSASFTQLLVMVPLMLGMGAMTLVNLGRSNTTMSWLFGGLFAASTAGMLVLTLTRSGAQKRRQLDVERRDYLRYLANLRRQVQSAAARQSEAMIDRLPPPRDLWSLAGTARMWQRSAGDPEFGQVRIGTGPQLLATPLRPPQTAPVEDLDPVSSSALRTFIRTFGTVSALPVAVSVRSFSRITVEGERPEVLGLARAILGQLAIFHPPGALRIACQAGADRQRSWEWLKWLPHACDGGRMDAAGPVRLVGPAAEPLVELLDLDSRPAFSAYAEADPHVVYIVDGVPVPGEVTEVAGVTVLDVGGWPGEPDGATLSLLVDGDRIGMRTPEGVRPIGRPDRLDEAPAEFLARQLTSLSPTVQPLPDLNTGAAPGLADLLGIADPRAVDPAVTWRPRPARDRLRVPIGVDPAGRPLDLDLKESAEGGMGPHGLVIGATGSGKSELLRTLVTGLAVTHSSEVLNLALIDFKGGATFAGMTDLPHTCAVITNLSDDLTMVDRMGDALRGEMVRRQELLRSAGNFAAVKDYERARLAGADLAPLPSLMIIIDEFSELLTSRPEFAELFGMIGRLGRSVAMHMLLASQNLDEGRLRGIDTHLSYRIALRTFSSAASRAVLGVPDAYELPPIPGSAYLRTDTATLLRFKSSYVSGPLPARRFHATQPAPFRHRAMPFPLIPTPAEATPEDAAPAIAPQPDTGETVMDAMLSRLTGSGPAAHQIWLPPLADPATADQLLPGLTVTPDRGLCLPSWPGNGRLTVPIAIVDKPFEQRRDLLWIDLSGSAGHAVVVGGPQSGKSTLLRTLVALLALTHTPVEVQVYLLDFGGGTLTGLSGLPHISGYAGRLDVESCRRTLAELTGLLAERERIFSERGIDSMAAFRRQPPPPADGRVFGDVFLVVDGWLTLRQEFEELEEQVGTLAARGLGYGIHVVLAANRWTEIRPALRDLIGTQVELRLGDPADSVVDRRAAANVPVGVPGRGLTADKLAFLGALPRIDGRSTTDDLADGVADLVAKVGGGWTGPSAPKLRLLPQLLPITALLSDAGPAVQPGSGRVPLGIAEADLAPVYADFAADPHFLAFGDTESGKTGLLRLLAAGIQAQYKPDQAAVLVVDYRRSLLDAVAADYLLEYCGSDQAVAAAVAQVERAMRERLPGPEITPQQLRDRSWWTGPELFVLVDDYDLVVTPAGNPLAPLAPLLAQAKDIGLHLILTRRSGGASRALFEPILQRLRDLATPGLVLSGSKDEGPLLGPVKPGPLPPGRGRLVTRRAAPSLVQLAWIEPTG
ncbi:type VII secretion protein EccCa [Hamadaea sp. NPDC051192]|uniref:type VII secretion protein EccCa n=1 Tax=Hamadaea sp. NPDC051192 TaxID=3154940 RepID=UPI003412BB10